METNKVYDLIGIGVGPFNLGLAALIHELPECDALFIDSKQQFTWHPGLLLPTAKMQVPFYADLVTPLNPCSPFSYLNYVKSSGRLFQFAIAESWYPLRVEYRNYCRWVVDQLSNVKFGCMCTGVEYDEGRKLYYLSVRQTMGTTIRRLVTRRLVLGTGTRPYLPDFADSFDHPSLFHSADYLHRKDIALMNRRITLIGSGQSAAEIFQDLLPHVQNLDSLQWFTGADRFYAMDYSKLSLEMSTPDYIRYFYQLDPKLKAQLLPKQHDLYKGINTALIEEIYQQLYQLSLHQQRQPELRTNLELTGLELRDQHEWQLIFHHRETGATINTATDTVILATGYSYAPPAFLSPLRDQIRWTADGHYDVQPDYSIDRNHTLFVQNAELASHGFNAADLGLGPYRNSVIINAVLGRTVYPEEPAGTFQTFK